MANELVKNDWLNKPNELVTKMTIDEAAMTYAVMNALKKGLEESLRDKLFKSSLNKLTFTLPNGVTQEMTISRAGITTKITKTKAIDYNKAVAFAKEHGYNIPMIPERIIPAELDKEKIENEPWFQENLDQFITVKEETKETKSTNRILIKDVK